MIDVLMDSCLSAASDSHVLIRDHGSVFRKTRKIHQRRGERIPFSTNCLKPRPRIPRRASRALRVRRGGNASRLASMPPSAKQGHQTGTTRRPVAAMSFL